jgi:hypothetical protein
VKKIKVENEAFEGQDIFLDGHTWKQCTFTNCNIIMERGEFDLVGCSFNGCRLSARGGAMTILKVAKLFFPQQMQVPLIDTDAGTIQNRAQ